ncbi:MAG TPA: YdcF family protein, partial [Clostridia bacterium]|nr:YdcF family protein [Clostridia bacterium]
MLLLCELTILGWLVACVSYSEQTIGAPGPADAIVVLGAQVKPWGVASDTLLLRMQLALRHYEEEPRLIVCCGGQGEDEPMAEGDFMRQWMIEQGVPEELVVSENTSSNTRENIAGAKAILEARGLTTALIITSDYHLPRALATCAQAELPATG